MRLFILSYCFTCFFALYANAQIDTALLQAIKRNDLAAIKERVQQPYIDINAKNLNGSNALMWAVYFCDLPVIQYLVRHGALVPERAVIYVNDNYFCYGSLQVIAAGSGKIDVLQYLSDSLHLSLEEKARGISLEGEGFTPMNTAVSLGQTEVVNFLLQKGVHADRLENTDTDTPLFSAATFEHWEIFSLLLQTGMYKDKLGILVDSVLNVAKQFKKPFHSKTAKAVALQQFTLSLRKYFFGEESLCYASGLNSLAFAHNAAGSYDSAQYYTLDAMRLLQKMGQAEHPEYIRSLHDFSHIYYNTAKYEQAFPLLLQAQGIINKIYVDGNSFAPYIKLSGADAMPGGTALCWPTTFNLNTQALMHARLGRYDKALKCYRQALEIARVTLGDDNLNYAYVANNMAFAYSGVGLHQQALSLYQKGLMIKKEFGEDRDVYGGNLLDIGYAYNQLGQYREALPCFEQAATILKKWFGEKHQYYAMCMDGQAFIYEHIGEYEKAIKLYKQAFTIYKDAFDESHPYCGSVLNNLATLYKRIGRYEEASHYYQQALEIRKKSITEAHPDYAQNVANLGSLYEQRGNYDSALYLYNQALALTRKTVGEEHQYYANCLANLASLYDNIQREDTSLLLYHQALSINNKVIGEDFPENVNILNHLGLLYKAKSDDAASSFFFTKASRLQLKNLKVTYATLSEGEKMSFLGRQAFTFSYIPSALCEAPKTPGVLAQQLYQNELALKSMVLEDQKQVINNIRKSNDTFALALYNQWQFNKAFLGKQLLLPITQRVSYFDSLRETTNGIEQELSRRSSAFNNQYSNQNISAATIAGNLKRGGAAVEFIRFQLYNKKWTDSIMYAAIILLAGDTVPHFIPLCEEKQLQRILTPSTSEPVYAIQKLYPGKSAQNADSLYQLIWKPLEKYLQNVSTVYYAPAGLLHRIAFQALRISSAQMLIDKYKLNQVLSTRAVAVPAQNGKPLTAGLWGNINYDVTTDAFAIRGSKAHTRRVDSTISSFNFYTSDTKKTRGGEWTSLPETKKEIDSLRNTFKNSGVSLTSITDTAATEEAFKALDGKSPQLLHLATHGFFLPVAGNKVQGNHINAGSTFNAQQNPMFRSGLVLANGNRTWKGKPVIAGKEDGILTAYEIAQMDLSNTDLVVLSACETALGDLQGNEGVIGLQRAFKMAGVKQIIMSLWQVPDKATRELMTLFYNNWLGGLSTREALRKAQLRMKEKYPPYFWAAFVLVE